MEATAQGSVSVEIPSGKYLKAATYLADRRQSRRIWRHTLGTRSLWTGVRASMASSSPACAYVADQTAFKLTTEDFSFVSGIVHGTPFRAPVAPALLGHVPFRSGAVR